MIYLLLLLALPLAANVAFLFATESGDIEEHMMGPMALILPLFLCILDGVKLQAARGKALRACLCLAMTFVMYGNALQVVIDQFAMQQGRTATMTLADEMLHSLNNLGYLNPETPICVVGEPAWNPLTCVERPFRRANRYAQYGTWPHTALWGILSWNGIFEKALGAAIKLCDEDDYAMLLESEEVLAMPVYPAEGSIAMMDNGIVVIKISEEPE